MKDTVKFYLEESKWLPDYQSKKLAPTMEEYTKIAFDSTTYPMLTMASFVGMGEIATEQAFDWLIGKPQMLRAACLICRFMDDIVSYQVRHLSNLKCRHQSCYKWYNKFWGLFFRYALNLHAA